MLLLAQTREDPGNRLGQREDLLHRQKLVEELRLVGHGPEPAPDIELEALLCLAVGAPLASDEADVVHAGQAAVVLGAA